MKSSLKDQVFFLKHFATSKKILYNCFRRLIIEKNGKKNISIRIQVCIGAHGMLFIK